MIDEVPGLTPKQAPAALMVATVVLLLVHDTVGPAASDRIVVLPWQTVVLPRIAVGVLLTVIL